MSMKKIELLQELMNDVPVAEHPVLNWLDKMGIDDDTTVEDLDRYSLLLYGLDKFQKKMLFAVLDTVLVYNLEQFEQIVDEIHANRWVLDEDIRDVYQLHYFLKHDYEEKPDEGMSVEDLLCGDAEPTLGKEMLEDQRCWGQGGLSCYGWVSVAE